MFDLIGIKSMDNIIHQKNGSDEKENGNNINNIFTYIEKLFEGNFYMHGLLLQEY